MLRFFYLNKLRYEKGQLAPVFIAVLAIILIMTLVTVNLSKVSLTKTETSNAVDAGALACASSMASVFNGIAASNSQLEVSYWESFAVISASFVIALYYAIMATIFAVVAHIIADAGVFMVLAICFITICNGCSSVVDAIKNAVTTAVAGVLLAVAAFIMESWVAPRLTRLILTMASIIIGVSALHIAQHFFFLNIKRQAMKGRKEALKLGYRIAFKNSGIAGKLRDDTPVVENSLELIRALLASGASFTLNSLNQAENYEYDFDDEENHSLLQLLNSQNSFSLFMSTLRHWPLYIYPWQDGQGRGHLVVVTQKTMDVNNYILHSTLLPFPAEMALLSTALGLAIAARALATSTTTAYSAASGSYLSAAVTFATAAIALAFCCVIPATCPAACADYEAAYGLAIAGNTSGMTGIGTNTALISLLIAFYPVLGASYVGLLPGYSSRKQIYNPE